MKRIHQIAAAVALCVVGTLPALAQVSYPGTTFTNGTFGSGLTGWTSYGDVLAAGDRVRTTTASLDNQDDAPLAAGFLNESQTTAAVNFFESPTLAGIPVESFDIGGVAYEGSAIRQDFNAFGGDVLTVTFDWAFLSTDTYLGDYGFVAVNDSVYSFVDISSPTLTGNFMSVFTNELETLTDPQGVSWTWYQTGFTYAASGTGATSLTLGVIDIGDDLMTSQVRFDNVAVSAVPEPETFAMLLAGLALVGGIARRRKA